MAKVFWYYQQSGEEHGPVSTADLRRLAAQGDLAPTDLVRRDSMEDWVAAHRLRGVEFNPAAAAVGTSAKKSAKPAAKAKKEAKPARSRREEMPASLESGEPSGIIRRWIAFVIDSSIATVLCFVGFAVGGTFAGAELVQTIEGQVDIDKLQSSDPDVLQEEMMKMNEVILENIGTLLIPLGIMLGLGILLPFLYHLIFEWSRAGGTLGKILCGIKITTTDGEHPGVIRITWRFLMKFFVTFGILCGVGALVALFTSLKQSTHDLLSGTMVVRK